MICYLYPEPYLYFFTSDVPALLYYSHIPAIFIALLLGIFVYFSQRNSLLNQLFFAITLCFSIWTLFALYTWTNIHSEILIFMWSFFGILQALIAILSIYFISVYIKKKDVGIKTKLSFFVLLLPVLLLSTTDLHLSGYNLTNCDAFGYEGLAFHTYYTVLGAIAMFSILVMLVKAYRKETPTGRKQILLLGTGLEMFLGLFFFLVFLGSYLTDIGITEDSQIELYGLFGMIIFMFVITVQIVRFKAFNVSLAITNALVIGLVILVGSQFTFVESTTAEILTGITLLLALTAGFVLTRSVRAEVRQRRELESLTTKLEAANVRLQELDKQKSEFVSIASHQLRSPLTAIRGYASMLAEGSFGKMPEKASESAKRIEESAKLMAYSIEDYLNVSRIESGNMKYNLSDFNLRDMVDNICDDLRPEALKKGLILLFRSNISSRGLVNADVGKVNQIVHNLINNSLKYTPKGSISVFVRDDAKTKKIYVDITDTGIGMSKETASKLFHKFSRADNANSVNVSGTGLGLFVALKMAEAMGGTITAQSEGDGKGSTFTFELPLAM